jgi:hypothetical protein
MVTMKFGFDEALPIVLPCEIHSFFLTHSVYAFLFSPNCAKYPAHLMLLDLIILIILSEEYKL